MKVFALLITLVFQINPANASFSTTKVIGEDELTTVTADGSNVPAKFKVLLNAFGLISMGCTATHIGNGYVITAGHCFYAPDTLTKKVGCPDVNIQWGMREGLAPYLTSTCVEIVAEVRNKQSDFAIIKVSPVPSASVGLELARKAQAGDLLTVFSHPEELPLQWSKTCVVEATQHPKLPPDSLNHICDTNPGSSGATLLDVSTGRIVGIHDGGRLDSVGVGMNYGTYITNPDVADTLKELGFK